MRRAGLLALAILLLLSAGCAGKEEPKKREISALFSGDAAVDVTMDVTADFGLHLYEFTLRYAGTPSGGTLTVLAPEEIAGVTARIAAGSYSVEYDGLSLELGDLSGRIGPVNAFALLLREYAAGYVTALSSSQGELAVTTQMDDDTSQTTWFDEQTLLPLRAEIVRLGRQILTIEFTKEKIGEHAR